MATYDNISNMHIDIMKEIGNIGAGNAATAMARMLNQKIKMDVPKVNLLQFTQVSQVVNGPEKLIAGILISLSGDINGMMMFLLEQGTACTLINNLMGKSVKSFDEFTELDMSAVSEIGNIMTGSYLGALSTLTKLKIRPSIPFMTIDMAGAILSVPAVEFGKVGDKVLFIESTFSGDIEKVGGYFILVPEIESLDIIMRSLGVMQND